MTPDALAQLQARAYEHMVPWSARDFADLLAQPGIHLFTQPHGFLLARLIADEAEILALATDPTQQRHGIATRLMGALTTAAWNEGVARIFLEVAARNVEAIAFYTRHGFETSGRRRGYYRLPQGGKDDAIIMVRTVTQGHSP